MNSRALSKTFGWMFIGLLVTFLTGYIISANPNMLFNVMSTTGLILILIIEFALVIFLSTRITKMKPITAKISFLLYSFVSGLTFASIFIYYAVSSIIYIFLAAAITFAIMALIGYTTKLDLTKIGSYLLFALIAAIIVSLVNMFLNNSMIYLIVSIVCVLIFIGITAYDVQKIKNLENSGLPVENLAIYGALDLYLDFINLFIHLLSIFGRRDN